MMRPSGTAITIAKAIPAVAIAKVSTVALSTSDKNVA